MTMTPASPARSAEPAFPVGDLLDGYPATFGTFVKLCRATWTTTTRVAAGLPGSISHAQFTVLEALNRFGPMYQRDISRQILRTSASVNVVVDGLEKRGLVARTRSSQDKRFVQVSLTEEGGGFIEAVLPLYMRRVRDEFAVLTEAEQEELGRLCRKLGLQQTDGGED
jgi:MarR family 2-MHQ and catechol resistance regulon transcriptional repressor